MRGLSADKELVREIKKLIPLPEGYSMELNGCCLVVSNKKLAFAIGPLKSNDKDFYVDYVNEMLPKLIRSTLEQ